MFCFKSISEEVLFLLEVRDEFRKTLPEEALMKLVINQLERDQHRSERQICVSKALVLCTARSTTRIALRQAINQLRADPSLSLQSLSWLPETDALYPADIPVHIDKEIVCSLAQYLDFQTACKHCRSRAHYRIAATRGMAGGKKIGPAADQSQRRRALAGVVLTERRRRRHLVDGSRRTDIHGSSRTERLRRRVPWLRRADDTSSCVWPCPSAGSPRPPFAGRSLKNIAAVSICPEDEKYDVRGGGFRRRNLRRQGGLVLETPCASTVTDRLRRLGLQHALGHG